MKISMYVKDINGNHCFGISRQPEKRGRFVLRSMIYWYREYFGIGMYEECVNAKRFKKNENLFGHIEIFNIEDFE